MAARAVLRSTALIGALAVGACAEEPMSDTAARLSVPSEPVASVMSERVGALGSTPFAATFGDLNYVEALQKTLFFYDTKRSGNLAGDFTFNAAQSVWSTVTGQAQPAFVARATWRGNSALNDSAADANLAGGWYDAGDHVKFGFPMAAATTMLAWGAVDYGGAIAAAGLTADLLENLRWVDNYLDKVTLLSADASIPAGCSGGGCSLEVDHVYGQVGLGANDHGWNGPAEHLEAAGLNRVAGKVSRTCGGSELTAEMAAALAASSMVFRANPSAYATPAGFATSYADYLLDKAEKLYYFADKYRKNYDGCITDAAGFYKSYNLYTDDLAWGAVWLYRARLAQSAATQGKPAARYAGYAYTDLAPADYASSSVGLTYLDIARKRFNTYYAATKGPAGGRNVGEYRKFQWTHNWNDKSFGTALLLARLATPATGLATYVEAVKNNLDWWTGGPTGTGTLDTDGKYYRVAYTPGGLASMDAWGNLRYVSTASFLAFQAADFVVGPTGTAPDATRAGLYEDFATGEIDYMLGHNPVACPAGWAKSPNPAGTSFVIGFGGPNGCYPLNPHSRDALGSWLNTLATPALNFQRHIQHGGLSGGPSATEVFTDCAGGLATTACFQSNEPATDYEAFMVGNLARMSTAYGVNAKLTPFPPTTGRDAPAWDDDELYATAYITSEKATSTAMKMGFVNKSGWAPRLPGNFYARYYFTLDDPGMTVGVTNLGGRNFTTATASAPVCQNGTDCYIQINFTGGNWSYATNTTNQVYLDTFIIGKTGGTGTWSATGDASHDDVVGASTYRKTAKIELFKADGTKLWGNVRAPLMPVYH